jgi:hypothetical protein
MWAVISGSLKETTMQPEPWGGAANSQADR